MDAQILDYNGLTPLLAAGVDTDGISSFLLTDNRDTKTYKVRRLADGRCWMVQDLALDLDGFSGTTNLTNRNTDLNTIDSWDPSPEGDDADEPRWLATAQRTYYNYRAVTAGTKSGSGERTAAPDEYR